MVIPLDCCVYLPAWCWTVQWCKRWGRRWQWKSRGASAEHEGTRLPVRWWSLPRCRTGGVAQSVDCFSSQLFRHGHFRLCQYLAVNSQHQQHREEEDGPQRGDWQLGDGLGISQKCQARSLKHAWGGGEKGTETIHLAIFYIAIPVWGHGWPGVYPVWLGARGLTGHESIKGLHWEHQTLLLYI